jgi:wyosine [tRNA(Phe)-imidazoG37] synthetase (radical SAM superfamily)
MDPMPMSDNIKLSFGPVPSRRLGRSIGINNIPPKICSYSCIYCQVGKTYRKQIQRRSVYSPRVIFQQVRKHVEKTLASGESIDYLTFVPDGEPTLDAGLAASIDLLKPLGLGVAVITNASLMADEGVRNDLMKADWVSIKIDSVREKRWRKINRPHRALELGRMLNGILEFARQFTGTLTTETMLVGCNVEDDSLLDQIAGFIKQVAPATAYLSIPTRPPAEGHVLPPDPEDIIRAYRIFRNKVDHVEYLIGYEGDAFSSIGNAAEDLLGITAVHPMRLEAVERLLLRAGSDRSVVDKLVRQGKLTQTEYEGHTYYLRHF